MKERWLRGDIEAAKSIASKNWIYKEDLKRQQNQQCVKPCTPGKHQNSWDLWMVIPLKMLLIGIDPYPNQQRVVNLRQTGQILQAAEASNPVAPPEGSEYYITNLYQLAN